MHRGLVLSMEHRAAAAPDPVDLRLVTTDQQRIHLEVTGPSIREDQPQQRDEALAGTVLDALAEGPAMTRHALRERLAIKNQTLGRTLQRLERLGRVERSQEGWRLRDDRGVPVPRSLSGDGNGTRRGARDLGGG